jgi:hypothetical protein
MILAKKGEKIYKNYKKNKIIVIDDQMCFEKCI